jgi:hypothetical protein
MGVDASEDEMNKMGVGELVLLGSGLGVLHVFTGLDHVAAIMTISVPPAPSPARERYESERERGREREHGHRIFPSLPVWHDRGALTARRARAGRARVVVLLARRPLVFPPTFHTNHWGQVERHCISGRSDVRHCKGAEICRQPLPKPPRRLQWRARAEQRPWPPHLVD